MSKRFSLTLFTLAFLLCMCIKSMDSYAQTNAIPSLKLNFLKDSSFQTPDSLYFNVLLIENTSLDTLKYMPQIEAPKGWGVFTGSTKYKSIPPGELQKLPVRILISKKSLSGKAYVLRAKAFSPERDLLGSDTCTIQVPIKHKWSVIIPNKELSVPFGTDFTKFSLKIANEGNLPEILNLSIKLSDGLKMNEATYGVFETSIELAANSDTSLFYFVQFGNIQATRNLIRETFVLTVSNSRKSVNNVIVVNQFRDQFENFIPDEILPYHVELGASEIGRKGYKERYTFSTSGRLEYPNDNISYFFNNYDILNNNNFLERSNYQLSYKHKNIKLGLGTINSDLGRNLYSRHTVNLNNRFTLGPTNFIDVFAAADYVDPIKSIAAGHTAKLFKKTDLLTTFSFNWDDVRKINTGNVNLLLNNIPMPFKHFINLHVEGIREDYNISTKYSKQGLSYDITYGGAIGRKIRFSLNNRWGDKDQPGTLKGLEEYSALFNYFFQRTKYLRVSYSNSERNPNFYDIDGAFLYDYLLDDELIKAMYFSKIGKKFTFGIGPTFDKFSSRRPLPGSDLTEIYESQSLNIEINLRHKAGLNASFVSGIRKAENNIVPVTDDYTNNLHANLNYFNNGLGLSLSYDLGPQIYYGIYQASQENEFERILLIPYIRKYLFNRFLLFSLNAAFNYRLDNDLTFVNINPGIQADLGKNWIIKGRGNINYIHQETSEISTSSDYSYFEVAIRKNFRIQKPDKPRPENYDLDILFYKDLNSNRKYDEGEPPVENIMTKLQMLGDYKTFKNVGYQVPVNLVSNSDGEVSFKNIYEGNYEINITALSNLMGFINMEGSIVEINLDDDKTYYHPFSLASRISGKIKIQKEEFSRISNLSVENIRITAIGEDGRSFSTLSMFDGSYMLFVPAKLKYTVSLNNIFTGSIALEKNNIQADLGTADDAVVDFIFKEKERKIKFKSNSPRKKTNRNKENQQKKEDTPKTKPPVKTKADSKQEIIIPASPGSTNTQTINNNSRTIKNNHFYIIIYAFKNAYNAEKVLQKSINRGESYFVIQNPKSKFWYICQGEYKIYSEAANEVKKIRNSGQYPDAWIFIQR